MYVRSAARLLSAATLLSGIASLLTAQPAPKPPVLPPINPAVAKLDLTISGLDGPGFCIAAGGALDLVAAGCDAGTIQVWKKETFQAVRENKGKADVWKGHQGPVLALAWNGGPVLASAGADRKVIFWQSPSGETLNKGTVETLPRALAMTGDGKTLASAGESDTIQLWDVAAGKPTAKLQDKSDWILCLAFSGDGKQLIAGANDGTLRLWDVAGSKKVRDLPAAAVPPPKPAPEPTPATSVVFAPDGKTIVFGTGDGPIHFVTLADGKIVRTLVGHTSAVTGLAFHPTGNLLVSSSKDRTLRLWNPAAPQPLKTLEGHTAWIEGLALLNQGTQVATVGADQTVRLWDLAEAKKK